MSGYGSAVVISLSVLAGVACIPNPAWDGCVGGDPCANGNVCDAASGDCVSAPSLPPELADLALAEWTPVSRNVVAAADPCPAGDCSYSGPNGSSVVVEGWNGGVYADAHGPYGGLVVWGGGATNYDGNEVYVFDLATLLWSRLSEPTDGRTPGDPTTFEPNLDTCTWWDGAPIPAETLGNVVYASKHNAFVIPTARSGGRSAPRPEQGCATGRGFSFDLGTGEWSLLQDEVETIESDAPSAYDPSRDIMWSWLTSGQLASYAFEDGTWTIHNSEGQRGSEAMAAIVPDLDVLVVADFSNSGGVRVRQLDNPWADSVLVSTTGATEIEQTTDPGFSWAQSISAIVTWSSGGPLYLLHPPSGDWKSEPWRWERLEVGGTPPPAPPRGPYGRFQVVDDLGIALVTTRINEPVFAVRYR